MAGRQPTAQEVAGRIKQILARPEFGRSKPGSFDRFRRWLSNWFYRLRSSHVKGGSSIGAYVLFAIIVVGIVAIIVWWLRQAAREHSVEEAKATSRHKSAADWNAEAGAFVARGMYRDAVRCRYKGLVAMLAERHLLHEVPGRTAGELRGDVTRDLPSASIPFDAASTLFERAWYSSDDVSEADLAKFDELSNAVHRASH